jgi:hypothetical protein
LSSLCLLGCLVTSVYALVRWCSEDGKKFGKEIESVAPPIPTGWEVTKSWRTYGTDNDPEGWQYSQTFESPYWYADVEQGRGCKC